jgi:hypothetical protein
MVMVPPLRDCRLDASDLRKRRQYQICGVCGLEASCDHALVNHGTRARAYALMERLSVAGLDLDTLFEEASRVLARALPHDSTCWHTVDPATLIETGYLARDMPPPDATVVEGAYRGDDFNSFVELAGARRHSGVLSEATGGRLDRSPRYRDLLRPNNVQGELRVSFVVDGAAWGCGSFFRIGPADFT